MDQPLVSTLLKRVLDCFGKSFTVDSARQVARLRLDKRSQEYVDTLADKCTEGTLTADERAEYLTLVTLFDRVAILQSKARQFLAKKRRSPVSP